MRHQLIPTTINARAYTIDTSSYDGDLVIMADDNSHDIRYMNGHAELMQIISDEAEAQLGYEPDRKDIEIEFLERVEDYVQKNYDQATKQDYED